MNNDYKYNLNQTRYKYWVVISATPSNQIGRRVQGEWEKPSTRQLSSPTIAIQFVINSIEQLTDKNHCG